MEYQSTAFQRKSEHIRNIPLDIILTLVTCGIFNFFVQYYQMKAVNEMLKQEKYSFITWFLLVLVTCGLFHIYHEYAKSVDIARVTGLKEQQVQGILSLVLTFLGLFIITDAIQQSQINEYFLNQKGLG